MAGKEGGRRERPEVVDLLDPERAEEKTPAHPLVAPFRSKLFQIVAVTAVVLVILGFWDPLAILHEPWELISIAVFVSILYALEAIVAWAHTE